MLKLIRDAQIIRAAFDGAAILDDLRDDAARLAVLKSVDKAERMLSEFFVSRAEAENIISVYPDAPAAKPLKEMLELQMPELGESEAVLKEKLLKIKEILTK